MSDRELVARAVESDPLTRAILAASRGGPISGPEAFKRAEEVRALRSAPPAGARVLASHWLSTMECDHVNGTDRAHCSCGRWSSEPQPNVGEAAKRWAEHALAETVAPPAGETPFGVEPHPVPVGWVVSNEAGTLIVKDEDLKDVRMPVIGRCYVEEMTKEHALRLLASQPREEGAQDDPAHEYIPEKHSPAGCTPTCSCGWRGQPQLGGSARDQWVAHAAPCQHPRREPATHLPPGSWRCLDCNAVGMPHA